MMKKKFQPKDEAELEPASPLLLNTHLETIEDNTPGRDLLSRLATGSKVQVDEKSMKRLTIKNYEKLPEIIKKKEEQKKQEELR